MGGVSRARFLGSVLGAALLFATVPEASAFEFADGRIQVHGFYESQIRTMMRDLDQNDGWDLTQWYHVLNVEVDWDIAPDGKFTKLYRISPPEPWRALRTQMRSQGEFRGSDEGGKPFGFFSAATGITIYRGHAWPAAFHGQLFVASEMKALMDVCNQVHEFPPGHYWCSGRPEPEKWYSRPWMDYESVADAVTDREALRKGLEDSVVGHLMTDVPYGVLLSGGLDSSITAALAARHAEMRVEDHEEKPAWWPRLHSFAIGLEGSPDLLAAQRAADHIGTVHHGFTFTIQEGLDALEEVIYHLETYDVTTIRAATPMFLMARKIRAMGIKMVLSGEGADEIFGGYLYFHKAPTPRAFHEETVRKLSRLHSYDCLRANKAMAAWVWKRAFPSWTRSSSISP